MEMQIPCPSNVCPNVGSHTEEQLSQPRAEHHANWYDDIGSKDVCKDNCHIRSIQNATKSCIDIIGVKQDVFLWIGCTEAPDIDQESLECGHGEHRPAFIGILLQHLVCEYSPTCRYPDHLARLCNQHIYGPFLFAKPNKEDLA
jgi:hypothetical protein